MTFILIWILLSIGAGAVAHAKGRNAFGYFLLALVLSPLVGFIIAVCMPSKYYVDSNGVRRRIVTEAELVQRAEEQAMTENDRRSQRISNLVALAVGTIIIVGFIVISIGH